MGFGDVNSYGNDPQLQPIRGFGAVTYRQRPKAPPKPPPSPTLTAASTNANLERRLKAGGVEVPPPEKKQTLLGKALDILDRPGAAVRGAIHAAQTGGNIKESAKQGFAGQKKVGGQQLLKTAAQAGNPIAKKLTQSKGRRFAGGLAVDILADPLTFVTGGTAKVAQKGGALAKGVQKEIAKETGRNISKQSARRLADNAAKGQIPTGRMGTAVSRAMGYTAETKTIKTGFGKLAQTEQRVAKAQEAKGFAALAQKHRTGAQTMRQTAQELKKAPAQTPTSPVYDAVKPVDRTGMPLGITPAPKPNPNAGKVAAIEQQVARQEILAKQYGKMAKDSKKAIKDIKVSPTVANVPQIMGKVGKDKTTLNFMGVPVLNVTPVKTALGAVVEKLPGGTQVKDALGRVFKFNYTPTAIKGVERAAVVAGKERVTDAVREIPYVREKGMKEVARQWQGTRPQAAEMAPHVIEETIQGTPEATAAATRAKEFFAQDVDKFQKAGIPLNVIDNYVTHLYKDPPEKVKAVLDRWRTLAASKQVAGAKPYFTKSRAIPTLEEAKNLGLTPIEDVRQLTMIHRALTEQAVVLQNMGQDLVRMGKNVADKKPRVTPDGKAYVLMSNSGIPALEGKYIHPEVHEAVKNLYPIISNTDEGMKLLEKTITQATSAWKALVLFRPMFHLRNFVGNIFLNMADGLYNPLRYPQATAVLTGALKEVELNGRRIPAEAIREMFGRAGLAGQGMFREAAMGGTRKVTDEAAKMLEAMQRSGLGHVAYWARHPFEGSRKVGEASDSLTRMANFLHHLDRGLSPAEAAQKTRTALFDYGALTPTEQNIKKWVMPFYTWTRFALPRMTERLVGSPGVFTGAAHLRENAVSINDVDESHLPKWIRDNQAIPLWVDEKGQVHYMSLNLPLTELARIHEVDNVKGMAQEVAMMVNPLYTTPMQLAFNRSLLTLQEISKFEGGQEMWKDYGMFALGQLGAVREVANQIRDKEQEREFNRQLAQGKEPDVPPLERGPLEKWGITTVQHPARWARADVFRRRDQLMREKERAEMQGKDIPTIDEIEEKEKQQGGFENLATSRGHGFGALGNRTIKAAGNAPAVVRQAMDKAGVPPDWEPYMAILVQAESSGNPVAQNKTPVHTRHGREHATGLFQMLPSTFRAHAQPGHTDIWNPLDNTLAAISYIRGRYGHPANIPGLGQPGYKGY